MAKGAAKKRKDEERGETKTKEKASGQNKPNCGYPASICFRLDWQLPLLYHFGHACVVSRRVCVCMDVCVCVRCCGFCAPEKPFKAKVSGPRLSAHCAHERDFDTF